MAYVELCLGLLDRVFLLIFFFLPSDSFLKLHLICSSKMSSFFKFSATVWESSHNEVPEWGVLPASSLMGNHLSPFEELRAGGNSQKKQQVKFLNFPIIFVGDDLQRHICFDSPSNFALWWVIPGKYVPKIVTSTSLCSKSSFFHPC